jgi:hypothetical protein
VKISDKTKRVQIEDSLRVENTFKIFEGTICLNNTIPIKNYDDCQIAKNYLRQEQKLNFKQNQKINLENKDGQKKRKLMVVL